MGWWGLGLLVHGFSIWSGPFWLGRGWEERKVAELLAREKIRVRGDAPVSRAYAGRFRQM